MLTEIEVEGVGKMRQLNDWQIHRLRAIKPALKLEASLAMSLGMTTSQFRRILSSEQQAECRSAWAKLMSPESFGIVPIQRKAQPPAKGEHVPIERQISLGRKLIAIRAKLPHGHFRRWVEENSGLSMTQASRFMKAAREADNRPLEREVA